VCSTTILRRYEGRGLGAILKAYLLGAKEGASVALNQRFGCTVPARWGAGRI
jgi:hypothetical protein